MYSAKAIANYFLELGDIDGIGITPMHIQKLVYIAHGYHLATHNSPLFEDVVEAWRFGPVIPALYNEFAHLGSETIYDRAYEEIMPRVDAIAYLSKDEYDKAKNILDTVWDKYKKFNAIQLSSKTHEAGSPWDTTRKKKAFFKKNPPIDNDIIREYYYSLLQNDVQQ